MVGPVTQAKHRHNCDFVTVSSSARYDAIVRQYSFALHQILKKTCPKSMDLADGPLGKVRQTLRPRGRFRHRGPPNPTKAPSRVVNLCESRDRHYVRGAVQGSRI